RSNGGCTASTGCTSPTRTRSTHERGGGRRARGGRAQAVRRPYRLPEVRSGAAVFARAGRAGDRLRGAVERRQELAPERFDQPQGAGPDVEYAGADAGAQFLRCRGAAEDAPRRYARLRLRRGAEGSRQALEAPGER